LVGADTRQDIVKDDSDFECATEKEGDRHFLFSRSFLKHALVHAVIFVSLQFPKHAEVMIEEVKWAKGEIYLSAKSKHPVPRKRWDLDHKFEKVQTTQKLIAMGGSIFWSHTRGRDRNSRRLHDDFVSLGQSERTTVSVC
jgi:hypothetical protein